MSNIKFDKIVNKDNLLPPYYVPEDLIITDNNENNFHEYMDPKLKPQISASIYPFFLEMQESAKKDGINIIIDSGYRSYEYQQRVFNKKVEELGYELAFKYAALPGASEHQTGYAFDLASIRDGKYFSNNNDDEKEIVWMMKNCYKYGFILRYPKGKEMFTKFNYEPWHYRFVGKELAKILAEQGITMEEYEMSIKSKKIDSDRNINILGEMECI